MKFLKGLLCVVLALLLTSVIGIAAFAEDPSQDPGGESSDTQSTGPDPSDRTVTVSGDLEGVELFFNGSETSSKQLTVKAGTTVTFTVRVKDNYTLESIRLNGVVTLSPADGVYSFEASEDADSFAIRVKATYTDPGSGDTSGDNSGETSGDNSGETSGDNSGETSGDNSGETSGDNSGETSGDNSGETSGDNSGETSGDNSGETSGEVSEDDGMRPLVVTITGQGTVTVSGQTLSASGTVMLKNGVATGLKLSPAYGYTLTAVYLDGAYHSVSEYLTLTITERTTLSVTFTSGAVVPTTHKVTLTVLTEGGYMSASGQTASMGTSQELSVTAGSSLPVNVFPANDYEVDSFKVDGASKNLTNGSYLLSLIGADTAVTVSFKKVEKAKTSLEAADINWNPDSDGNIIVNTGNYTAVSRSVFEKINTLTSASGTTVVLQTPYVHWLIPCGSQITGVTGDEIQLRVAMNANGSYYETIKASINATDPSTLFNYYEADKLPEFPEGTKASFYMADYATKYSGNNVNLMVKSENALVVCGTGKVDADGWTTPMDYRNSRYMVVRVETAQYYKVTANAGEGGKVTPSGTNSVAFEENFNVTVTANSGYIIAAVYVDNVPVAGAVGGYDFSYQIPSVTGDHEIRAEFIASGTNYTVINNVAVPQDGTSQDEKDGPNVGLIVALVIVFVAVAGAAVLFIVKWRQEKF